MDGTDYVLQDTVSGSDETGQTVNVQKSFEGFVPKADSSTSITLKADSAQNVVNIYYARNVYHLFLHYGVDASEIEGTLPQSGDVYYGATLNTDMSKAKRTGYTFAGWCTDEAYTTPWEGTTMPAYEGTDFHLYAKWDTMTYFLRFDWDGNVPLRDWLLENGGKLLTAEYDETNYVYINANDHGIPYIDVTVGYDQVFTLPTGIPGADYFGYYEKKLNDWNELVESLVESESLTKMAAEQDSLPVAKIRELSLQYRKAVMVGYIEKDGPDIYSSYALIEGGSVIHNYRRISKNWKNYITSRTETTGKERTPPPFCFTAQR